MPDEKEFDGSQVESWEEVIPNFDGEKGYVVRYWTSSGDGQWVEQTRQDAVINAQAMTFTLEDGTLFECPSGASLTLECKEAGWKFEFIKE